MIDNNNNLSDSGEIRRVTTPDLNPDNDSLYRITDDGEREEIDKSSGAVGTISVIGSGGDVSGPSITSTDGSDSTLADQVADLLDELVARLRGEA